MYSFSCYLELLDLIHRRITCVALLWRLLSEAHSVLRDVEAGFNSKLRAGGPELLSTGSIVGKGQSSGQHPFWQIMPTMICAIDSI